MSRVLAVEVALLAIVLMGEIQAATGQRPRQGRAGEQMGFVLDQSPVTLVGEADAVGQHAHRPGDSSRIVQGDRDMQLSAGLGLPTWRPAEGPEPLLRFSDTLTSRRGGGAGDFWLVEDEHGVAEDENAVPGALERDWRGLGRDTAFFLGYEAVAAGFLYLLPESVTKWDAEQKKTSMHRWWENVQHPVWDKDNWYVNYLGHPYFGAISYIRARERGFGAFGGFWYAALLSGLYEFGIEALFERPSYQDLIVTPTAGLLLGALLFEPIRERLRGKPELVWYDHVTLFVTDPMGAANGVLERALGIQADIRVQFYLSAFASHAPFTEPTARSLNRPQEELHRSHGIGITFVFGERRQSAGHAR